MICQDINVILTELHFSAPHFFASSSSDLVSFSERNSPAAPPGRRQLPTPQTQAPIRPPGCSSHEEMGSHPQTSLQAESGAELRPAAGGPRPFWPGAGSVHSHELLVRSGSGQPAGASETWLISSDGAAAAATTRSTASSSATTCRVPTATSVRSPSSTLCRPQHSSCRRPPEQPLSGLHLPHAGPEHLPLQSLALLLHQLHAPLRLPFFLLLLVLLR